MYIMLMSNIRATRRQEPKVGGCNARVCVCREASTYFLGLQALHAPLVGLLTQNDEWTTIFVVGNVHFDV
jgi:hypothetical protein